MTESVDEHRPAQNGAGRRNGKVPAGAEPPNAGRAASSRPGEVNPAGVAEILDLPRVLPPERRLDCAWRENVHSRIADLDVEIDCLAVQLGTELSAPEKRRLVDAKGAAAGCGCDRQVQARAVFRVDRGMCGSTCEG